MVYYAPLAKLLFSFSSEIAASGQPPTNQQLQTLGHYYHGIGVGLMAQQEYEKVCIYTVKPVLSGHSKIDKQRS